MPHFDVSDCVFSLQPGEWKCIVSGRIHGSFYSRGVAEAAMEVEQRREAARKAKVTRHIAVCAEGDWQEYILTEQVFKNLLATGAIWPDNGDPKRYGDNVPIYSTAKLFPESDGVAFVPNGAPGTLTQAQEAAYLSLPTNAPIETVLDTLAADPGTDQRHMNAVAAELIKFGYGAMTEDTGGGIICIKIDGFPANGNWFFGTANDTWGGTFWDEDGSNKNVETDCSSEETYPAKIATAIHDAFVAAGITFEGDNPRYPRADWVYEVENDCTNLGYKEWAKNQRESNEDEDKVASVQITEQHREEMTAHHADALNKAMGVIASHNATAQAPVVPAETAPLYMAALNSFWLTVHSVYPNADRVTMPQAIAQAFEVAAAGVVEAWMSAYDAGGYSDVNFGG